MAGSYWTRASLVVFAIALPFARAFDSKNVEDIADVHCETVTLTHIDSDSAEIQVTVSGTARKSLTLDRIFFERATINGVPLRLSPARGPFRLQSGRPLTGLPTLSADLSFREIPSLEPMKEMVRSRTAHIHVELLARLDLNPFQMIALRSKTVWVSAQLDEDAPIAIPGEALGQLAATAALTAAEPVWKLANRGREWRDHLTGTGDNVQRTLSKSLVEVRTSFEIDSRGQGSQTVETHNVGLMLRSGRVLTVDEAVEPWVYSASLAESLNRHEASINPESVDIVVRLIDPDNQPRSEFSLQRGELRVIKSHSKTPRVLLDNGRAFERVALRDAPENAALLDLQGLHAPSVVSGLTDVPDFGDWKQGFVFRFDRSSHLVTWLTDVKQVDGRLILRDAVPDASGSPIWLESGVAGILQDDSSGEAAAAVLKEFPSESF